MHTLGLLQNIGTIEWVVLLALGLLIFGRRLPEVGRSLGRGIVEFRKGLKGIEDEVEQASSQPRPAAGQVQRPLSTEPANPALGPSPAIGGAGTGGQADLRVSRSDTVE